MCIRTVASRDKIPQFQVNGAVSQFDIDKEQVDIKRELTHFAN